MLKPVLRSDIKSKEKQVYIRYIFQRNNTMFRTSVFVSPKNFNSLTGKIRKTDPHHLEKNELIEREKLKIEKIIIDLRLSNILPTIKEVSNIYHNKPTITDNRIILSNTVTIQPSVYNFIPEYKKYIERCFELSKFTKKSRDQHLQTVRYLNTFLTEEKRDITFDMINQEFINDFIVFYYKKGLGDNTIDLQINHIKSFMNATKNKLHSNIAFMDIKRMKRKTNIVTLTDDEIQKILTFKPTTKTEEKTKDLFILGIATGLRYDDLVHLSTNNFIIFKKDNIIEWEQSYIQFNIQKSEIIQHRIPFNNLIKMIVLKHNIHAGKMVKFKMTNSRFNERLQAICKTVGLNEQISLTEWKQGKPIIKTFEKWEVVTCHVLRKSFISILLETQSESSVQAITGHQDSRSMKPYIKLGVKAKLTTVKQMDVIFEDALYKQKYNELKEQYISGNREAGKQLAELIRQKAKGVEQARELLMSLDTDKTIIKDLIKKVKKIATEKNILETFK